jgi:hypothetical protein
VKVSAFRALVEVALALAAAYVVLWRTGFL